jgi:hypothetical protein
MELNNARTKGFARKKVKRVTIFRLAESFKMPAADLFLNAASPTPDRSFAKNQAYVMVAVLDEKRSVIPGFEAEKCLRLPIMKRCLYRSNRIQLNIRKRLPKYC